MNDVMQRLEFDKILQRISHYASFSLGKKRVLASEPSFSSLIVTRDLDRLHESMEWIRLNGGLSFGGIQDVSAELTLSHKGGTLSIAEIIDVGRMMSGTKRLRQQFFAGEGTYTRVSDLVESLAFDEALLNHIEYAFGEQGIILDRASSALQTIRKSIHNLERSIDERTQEFLLKNRAILSENVVTLQHGRRTFLIKPSEKNKLDGTLYGSSASGQSVYFEPAFLARMQNELQNLQGQEKDEEERICQETSAHIGMHTEQLSANLDTLALLDSIFAKAEWGLAQNGCVARLTEDRLQLKHARHPLIKAKQSVYNDYKLEPPYRMILISGPNTGGKSVSLKTMGLAVLMSLSGCPVCADEAEVMLVDNLFVDIGDQQSIEKSLSSFSAHIETITQVTRKATSRSLILLDELGSQTDPLEGESLSMAILDYFRELGCWVVATTHFSRLKKYGTEHDDILIASVEFDLQNLQPTYRYREHVMGESNAFAIAKRLQLHGDIIDKAFKYKQEGQYEADHLLEILEAKISENDAIQKDLLKEQEALEMEVRKAEAQLLENEENLRRQEAALQEAYDEKAAELIASAQKQLEILNTTHRPDLRQKAVRDLETMKLEPVVKRELAVGDRVRLKATNQVGVIDSIEKNTAFVSIGGLKVNADVRKLELVASQPESKVKVKRKARSHSVQTYSSLKRELNVIGLRVAEALPLVEKYLDDCVVQKITSCRIVHGHGTGTLRNAVHDVLRRNKHVASFELATLAEGGAGATVVTFKS